MQIETIAQSAHHRVDLESAYRVNPATGVGHGHGKDSMFHEGELIRESRQPAFDAARHLLAKGLALPSDRLTTYRNGKACIYTTVGRAARLTVKETGKSGPRVVAYRGEEDQERLTALRGLRPATPGHPSAQREPRATTMQGDAAGL